MAITYSIDITGREFVIERYSADNGEVKYYVKSFNGIKSENFFMERAQNDDNWHIAANSGVSKDIKKIEPELIQAIASFRAILEN
jgi:hypothetical protein